MQLTNSNTMKRSISSLFLALLATFFSVPDAQSAGHGGFGLGFIIGAPTGLSVKQWIAPRQAFDAAAAWSTSGDEESLYLHGDYLFQQPHALAIDTAWLDWHYGAGISMKFDRRTNVGLRLPIGIDYSLISLPLEFFAEIVPVVLLTPDTGFDIDGGIGVRIFF